MDDLASNRLEVSVSMGSLAASNDVREVLVTFLGSCVGLCLYDPESKVAGLAHIMLPGSEGKDPSSVFEAKYADLATDALVSRISEKGGKKNKLVAKIAGGAEMLSNENNSHNISMNIGERNVSSLKRLLATYGIPLKAEDVGSTQGRWLRFYVLSGLIVLRKKGVEVSL